MAEQAKPEQSDERVRDALAEEWPGRWMRCQYEAWLAIAASGPTTPRYAEAYAGLKFCEALAAEVEARKADEDSAYTDPWTAYEHCVEQLSDQVTRTEQAEAEGWHQHIEEADAASAAAKAQRDARAEKLAAAEAELDRYCKTSAAAIADANTNAIRALDERSGARARAKAAETRALTVKGEGDEG